MKEVKKEIAHLQNEVSKLHIFELVILALVIFTIICFQVQYSRIHSYYQSLDKIYLQLSQTGRW